MLSFEKFLPLAKVAPHKREVTGVATHEMPDHDGEIMDYDSSKPYFMAWSDMVHKDTGGKSKGNVRAMHQPKAVGKLTDISYDDAGKAVYITAKVVDDQEWKKVMEGLYTGFSVGGNYVDKWETDQVLGNGKKAVRFTADPFEVSLVDRPSVPSALFTSVKMIKMVNKDGHEEDIPLSELAATAGKSLAFEVDSVPHDLELAADVLEGMAKRIRRRSDAKPEEGTRQYGDVEFADPTNKKYPIDTEEHIRAAWNYINKEKDASKYSPSEVSEIKSRIIAAWKRKIDAKGPPSTREGRKMLNPVMAKGLMRAGELVQCIEALSCFVQGQVMEDKFEEQMGGGKPSKLPKKVFAAIKELIPILQQYIEEESAELLTQVAEATSSEAQKMSTSSATGEALSRFDAVTKGVQDLVDLLKAARKPKEDDADEEEKARKAREDEDENEGDEKEKAARKERNKKRAEKAKKAREADDDEDEHEKTVSDVERAARKARNAVRAQKRADAEKAAKEAAAKAGGEIKTGEQPAAPQTKSAEGDLLKAIGDLTAAVKENGEHITKELDTLKAVVIMQATEITQLQGKVTKSRAPLLVGGDNRFSDAYLKAAGKLNGNGGGEGDFSSMLKGIYATARGEA